MQCLAWLCAWFCCCVGTEMCGAVDAYSDDAALKAPLQFPPPGSEMYGAVDLHAPGAE